MKKIKGGSSTELCRQLNLAAPLWARGYLARTSGKVRMAAVEMYLQNQAEHHGYANRNRPPVYRFRNPNPSPLSVAHAVFDLNYHIVLATRYRQSIFDSTLGEELAKYWLRVASRRNFALDQVTILPDHVHMLIRTLPTMSVEECTLLLMNNAQHFIGESWSHRLIEAGVNQLWQPSAYAGSCGELPTALLKGFLS
jgi:putative transposase